MDTGINRNCRPGFRLLDESQIVRIHHAVLRRLEETGVQVHHKAAVELLADHGCNVIERDISLTL